MKKSMLAGGGLGFVLGILSGSLTEGSSWPGILVRSSVAALAAGLLVRWWVGVLARCIAVADAERENAKGVRAPASPFLRANSSPR